MRHGGEYNISSSLPTIPTGRDDFMEILKDDHKNKKELITQMDFWISLDALFALPRTFWKIIHVVYEISE